MKLIIEDGPHYKIQMDLWYLNDDISNECGYNYIPHIVSILYILNKIFTHLIILINSFFVNCFLIHCIIFNAYSTFKKNMYYIFSEIVLYFY